MWLLVDAAYSCGPHAAESQAAHNIPLDTHQQRRARRHTPTDTGARHTPTDTGARHTPTDTRAQTHTNRYGRATRAQSVTITLVWTVDMESMAESMAEGACQVDASRCRYSGCLNLDINRAYG